MLWLAEALVSKEMAEYVAQLKLHCVLS